MFEAYFLLFKNVIVGVVYLLVQSSYLELSSFLSELIFVNFFLLYVLFMIKSNGHETTEIYELCVVIHVP